MKKLIKSLLVLTLLLTTTMALAAPPAIPGAGFGDISNTGNDGGNTVDDTAPPQLIPKTPTPTDNDRDTGNTPSITSPTVTPQQPIYQQPIYQQPMYGQPMQGFPTGGISTNSIAPRTITKSGPASFLSLIPVAAYAIAQRRKKFNQ